MSQAYDDPFAIRRAGAAALEAAMLRLRDDTLALFAALRAGLSDGMAIAYAPEMNPPRWELGHVGWFEEFWIARNSERLRGPKARLEAARAAPVLQGADALYDSSHVPHATRWRLDLPDADRTLEAVARIRERTLALLRASDDSDDALYFFRLVAMHEAMHHEAGLMIAQGLGLPVDAALPQAVEPKPLRVPETVLAVGEDAGGFAFDNELGPHRVELPAFEIDSAAVTWRQYLPFIEDTNAALPRHLARDDAFEHGFKRCSFGRWIAIDLDTPAMHLTAADARAWCRWAGRRLPTEHEWTAAQARHADAFSFGQVWEWTASPFAPFPGFEAHPYRDYSAPWFEDGRPVLKGGSFASRPLIKHPRYRNFFVADRGDVFAGLRSCARS